MLRLKRHHLGRADRGADVATPPALEEARGFTSAAKPLRAEALVAEFAVEGLNDMVLPRLARIDRDGLDVGVCRSLENGTADDLGAAAKNGIASALLNWSTSD